MSSVLCLAGATVAVLACGPNPPISVGTGGAGAGGAGSADWCALSKVMQDNCTRCHGTIPTAGAPMPLVTHADLTAIRGGRPVYDLVLERVRATDAVRRMPQGAPALPAAQINTIQGWVNAGRPGPSTQCSGGTGGAGGGGGTGNPPNPDVDADWPCNGRRVRLAAHTANSTAKLRIPNPTSDRYVCMNFNSPFRPGEIATYIRPIADDKRVIHHFILFGQAAPGGADGSHTEGCVTPNIFGQQVGGWAPGGGGGIFESDVGVKLNYPYLQLQLHYNNHLYNDAADASGIEVCVTTEQRPNIAGVITLGTDNINIPAGAQNHTQGSTCTNLSKSGRPITIIGTSPHMHTIGSEFRTTVAGQADLINIDNDRWVFDQQIQYPVLPRRVIQPNTAITTTCQYDNPRATSVGFGTATTAEMCYNFITGYPIDEAYIKCGTGVTFIGGGPAL
ncbi:MAG TPA: hypothetical protein VK524_03545 [Polyangiaceae bacterium]|nr:hypothetical protein [Polyangiaceae bacterium]